MPWFGYSNESPVTTPEETEVEDEILEMQHHNTAYSENVESSALAIPDEFTTGEESCEIKDGYWVCQPYKQEIIQQQIDNNAPGANRRTAIIGSLRDLGVKVFIIEAKSIDSTADILHHVKRVVGFVARENIVLSHANKNQGEDSSPLGFQRCLLYQDRYGRLLNLTLADHAAGPTAKYQDYIDSFSGLEAMVALTVLSRSFPCAMEGRLMGTQPCCATSLYTVCLSRISLTFYRSSDEVVDTLRPAYLSLILGLVLTEEISLSWINSSMMVRASPSVSAHTLLHGTGSDLSRKAVVLSLALAGAATGDLQKYMTVGGITLACLVLLANLGSRAWLFLKWKPLRYQGPGASVVAYLAAVATGIVVPYMGHRSMEIGGKASVEHVIKTGVIVALIFLASDLDEVQKFLIVGSERCNQDFVNVAVGGWWAMTMVISLFLASRIPYRDPHPNYDGEPLLVPDHVSPVGFKVPSLPDFTIDPGLAKTGSQWFSIRTEVVFGVFFALAAGAGIIYLAFTDWDEAVVDEVQSTAGDLF